MAHPSFSRKIGRLRAHADESARLHSENTIPTGGEPTNDSTLSEPSSWKVDPLTNSIIISFSSSRATIAFGNASEIRRNPECGFTAVHITLRACDCVGRQ